MPRLLIICGGNLVVVSIFFRYIYGPWGGELRLLDVIRNSLRPGSWPELATVWPVFFALSEVAFAWAALFNRESAKHRWHFVITGSFLGSLAAFYLASFALPGGWLHLERTWDALQVASAGLAGVGILLTVFALRTPERRSDCVSLIGAAWTLAYLYPVSESVPLKDVLGIVGPGYWMLLAGAIFMAAGSTWGLIACSGANTVSETEPPTE